MLFDLLSDAVPQDHRAAYRQLWESLSDKDRRPCPSCFGAQHKNVPLRELGEENGFLSFRCTGCFTVFYRPSMK